MCTDLEMVSGMIQDCCWYGKLEKREKNRNKSAHKAKVEQGDSKTAAGRRKNELKSRRDGDRINVFVVYIHDM